MINWLRIQVGFVRRELRQRSIDSFAFLWCKGRIQNGPFRGMKFARIVPEHPLSAKIFGTYEEAIAPVISWMMEAGFKQFINVGSAEGYYAIGLARSSPSVRVEAFECVHRMHSLLELIAAKNGVTHQITQHGLADINSLQHHLAMQPTPVLLMDIEGGERELLNPQIVPSLAPAIILVEVHLHVHANLIEILVSRFCHTHTILLFESTDCIENAPPRSGLTRLSFFVNERRGNGITPWLLMTPRNGFSVPEYVTKQARLLSGGLKETSCSPCGHYIGSPRNGSPMNRS